MTPCNRHLARKDGRSLPWRVCVYLLAVQGCLANGNTPGRGPAGLSDAAIVGCARAMRAEVVKKKVSAIGGAHAPASAAHHTGSERR